jgi:hypothetical protein
MNKNPAITVKEYLATLPEDRRAEVVKLRGLIRKHLPKGYKEVIQYGVIAYVVPLKAYPQGYLHRKTEAIPYAALANQKNHISLYLMSIYRKEDAEWFRKTYKDTGKKLNMGKTCVRFKKAEDLALDVIGKAVARLPMDKYIAMCDSVWASR